MSVSRHHLPHEQHNTHRVSSNGYLVSKVSNIFVTNDNLIYTYSLEQCTAMNRSIGSSFNSQYPFSMSTSAMLGQVQFTRCLREFSNTMHFESGMFICMSNTYNVDFNLL